MNSEGTETEVNTGTTESKMTRYPYFLSFMRHIDSIQQRLNDNLAPKYIDIVEVNKIRVVDLAKTRRLQALKVREKVNKKVR